jgi:hypothetical protein
VLFGYFPLIGPLYLIGVWVGEDQRTNTIKTHHVYKRLDYDFKFYYLPCIQFNSEHDWEDLCIQLNNQQRCTTDNLNQVMGGPISNLVFGDASSEMC